MKKIFYMLFFGLALYSQDEILLDDGFDIMVDPDRPRVATISKRVKPEFPEVPIEKSFKNEILDKTKNFRYKIQNKKVVAIINKREELLKLK